MVAVQQMMIVYWAIIQSISKVVIGAILLVVNSEDAQQNGFNVNRSKNGEIQKYGCALQMLSNFNLDLVYPDLLMLIGVIGIYCSLKLLLGLKRSSKKHLMWWIVYQWIAVLHLGYVYAVSLNIVDKSLDLHSFVKLFAVVAIVHVSHELFFFATIMKLYFSFNQLCFAPLDSQENESDDRQVLTTETDKPPCYDEVVTATVATV